MAVHFFEEDIVYKLPQKRMIKRWIKDTVEAENNKLKELNFIFCSDEYLLGINRNYLQHDTYTDIITFDNSEKQGIIEGDIFISIDRVRENAKTFTESEFDELCRILIHGTLHLLGYKDKAEKDKNLMTDKENIYLARRF